jgi:hypothetical protein
MRSKLRRFWPYLKVLFGLAIIFYIGRQFYRDLMRDDVWLRPPHPGWLVLSGVLYLAGLLFSAFYWIRLLGHMGPRPPQGVALRAYYLGHAGKYLPGKAWAVFLRASLVRGGGVRMAVATLTTFYEVLTTMAGGVLIAAVLFALLGRPGGWLDTDDLGRLLRLEPPKGGVIGRRPAVLLSLGLLGGLGVALVPPVFNRLAHHLSRPFRDIDSAPLPPVRLPYLLEGLAWTSCGWLLLGASTAATFQALLGTAGAFDNATVLGRLAAIMGLSYVVGFAVVVVPNGLMVREFLLILFLAPELSEVFGLSAAEARPLAVAGVVILRLVWTVAEVAIWAALYWGPRPSVPEAAETKP